MPNMPMCKNTSCTLKGRCYRFNATPDTNQEYGEFKSTPDPVTKVVGCYYFWETRDFNKMERIMRDREHKLKLT